MKESTTKAVLPFYKGSLIIEGTPELITSIRYTSKLEPEHQGVGEVYKGYIQLKEYINIKRKQFDLNVHIEGTEFQQAVYKALRAVGFHESVSYQELAVLAGYPKAARAVGQAMANNSLLIVVPCHRVLAANKKLGGFSGGLDVKQVLLSLEKTTYKL